MILRSLLRLILPIILRLWGVRTPLGVSLGTEVLGAFLSFRFNLVQVCACVCRSDLGQGSCQCKHLCSRHHFVLLLSLSLTGMVLEVSAQPRAGPGELCPDHSLPCWWSLVSLSALHIGLEIEAQPSSGRGVCGDGTAVHP